MISRAETDMENLETTVTRLPAAKVIAGCTTKSASIRALAKAGYLRTEIASLLGIRYQHVRKVLEDSGSREGLRHLVDAERSPVTITVDSTAAPTKGTVLTEAGFILLGEWKIQDGELILSSQAPNEAGVYAFLVDGAVVYIGLAQRGFKSRMRNYRDGREGQRTSRRVKGLISAALASRKRVEVLLGIPDVSLEWNGLPINAAAGLETALIKKLQPEWNMQGK